MNLRDEEQLQRYFEHTMSASEEQHFLIDIAARDDMRLAFRSNLELLKALRADKDAAVVSAALVRSRTLTALGLGGALLPNALKEHEVAQAAAMPLSDGSRMMTFIRRPAAMLLTGLLAGAALVYSLVPGSSTQNHTAMQPHATAPSTIIISTPAPQQVAEPTTTPAPDLSPSVTTSVSHHVAAAKQTKSETDVLPVVKTTKSSPITVQTNVHKGDPSK